MKERIIYLTLKSGDFDNLNALLSGYETVTAVPRPDGVIKLFDRGYEDSGRYHQLRALAMQEFFQDFAAFIQPDSPGFDMEPFLPLLKKVNPGIYAIADLIAEVLEADRPDWKNLLKKYYYSLFGADTIETVVGFIKADQNASKAASRLYMHRNTLNYRLDHFISLSEIDVRSFRGAVAVYLLFR